MAVAINSKTVLVAYCGGSEVRSKWFPKEQSGIPTFFAGDWFEAKAGKPIDLDVIIGERPGGNFRAKLVIQKKGIVYTCKGNVMLIPPFQLATTELTKKYPETKIWKGWQ